ncbi:MAG TPA: DUF6798 domain-containing protein, partial [Gemmatimonadales bacterium]|nr:DUF6798 domain-containing protein [Gemmatimonadales bacterium]
AQRSSNDALFIVPPGMEGFREYARRSIYVDFKLFPASTVSAVPEWRERLDLISAPDGAARAAAGWPAVPLWDRSYASRNTPARIAELLRTTGADYFVWDRRGLDVPPYVSLPRDPDPAVHVVYANDRFEVYALAGAAHAAR